MDTLKILIDQALPKATHEDMVVAIAHLIVECNEDSKRLAEEDPLQGMVSKEEWMSLQEAIYEFSLQTEFADYYLEHPDMTLQEVCTNFKREFDL
jgi:hypothetical protein